VGESPRLSGAAPAQARPAARHPVEYPIPESVSMKEKYPFVETEAKWQQYWAANGLFRADTAATERKFYCLTMFPYPPA